MVEPRVVVCMDTLYDASSTDLCLDVKSAEKFPSTYERTTQTISMLFHSITKDVILQCNPIDVNSVISDHYVKGEVPLDTKVLFWVFATHINTDDFPSQVCIGTGILRLHALWEMAQRTNEKYVKMDVVVMSRALKHGTITVSARRRDLVQFHTGVGWSRSPRRILTVDEEVAAAKLHATKEGRWVRSFSKVWGGVDNMVDLYGFLINGYAFPISFFLTTNRSDMGEKEWKVLLYYAMRRYAIEKGMKMIEVVGGFRSLPVKQKLSILGEMITLPVHSHAYMTDYVIDSNGGYRLLEIFQSASRGNSGDCEDFSRQLCNLWESFCSTQIEEDSTLMELQSLARMYVSVVSLDRTSVSNMSMHRIVRNSESGNTLSQGRRKMAARMQSCQGHRRDVSAHMNVFAIPRPTFFMLMRTDLSPKGHGTSDLMSTIASDDKEAFIDAVENHKENFDENFEPSLLDVVVLEGTGNFNCINEADSHCRVRDILSEGNSLSLGSHKIYHPVGDRKQFYLNTLLFITQYFMKRYRMSFTTFVCAYKVGRDLIYGTTYADLIRKSNDICLVPMWRLNSEETSAALSAARRNYRHPFSHIKNTARISSIADVESYKPFENIAVEDYRTVVGGTSLRDEAIAFTRAMANARSIVSVVNETGRDRGSVGMVFSFSYVYFLSANFLSTLSDELTTSTVVKSVTVYPEVFGETLRNIVMVVET